MILQLQYQRNWLLFSLNWTPESDDHTHTSPGFPTPSTLQQFCFFPLTLFACRLFQEPHSVEQGFQKCNNSRTGRVFSRRSLLVSCLPRVLTPACNFGPRRHFTRATRTLVGPDTRPSSHIRDAALERLIHQHTLPWVTEQTDIKIH